LRLCFYLHASACPVTVNLILDFSLLSPISPIDTSCSWKRKGNGSNSKRMFWWQITEYTWNEKKRSWLYHFKPWWHKEIFLCLQTYQENFCTWTYCWKVLFLS